MAPPICVTNDDVKALTPPQLVRILWQLVSLELRYNGLHESESHVPLSIYIKDGGIDGLAKWQGGPEKTAHLPGRLVGFQAKATDMEVGDCKAEVCTAKGQLKPQVRRVIEDAGIYILFLGRNCVEESKRPRRDALKEGIEAASRVAGDAALNVPIDRIRIYDASDIAAWINKYPAAVTQTAYFIGRPIGPAMGWEEQSQYPGMATPYADQDEKRTGAAAALRVLTGTARKTTRVIGQSGLGKTRLVHEAFRPALVGDPADTRIQADYCYVSGATVVIEDLVREWRRSQRTGVIVVDDCPIELHEHLSTEVTRADSRLSLVTIGNDLDTSAYAGTESTVILIEPSKNESIDQLLADRFPELAEQDRQFIVAELAQGFPLMAILVAQARKASAPVTARMTREVLAKLIGANVQSGSAAEKVIVACSLFEYVGVDGDLSSDREFVRITFCPEVSANDFYGYIKDFIASGAIGRYGRAAQVRPPPLAIRLAASWWERCPPETAATLIGSAFPDRLADAFCARLRMLDFVPAAREVAAQLCGHQGPFGQAKVLSSELGSRLFRAIAEVNPLAAVGALSRAFASFDRDELSQIEGGPRRNLVLALEKLCFRSDTFDEAVRFLSRLAAAENERWANNATGTLARLFMIFLPGTQAPLTQRLSTLQWLAASDDANFQLVAVSALENAIKTDNFSGTSGPEYQGSAGPQEEYRPKLWKEVFSYWSVSINELVRLAVSDSPVRDRAASAIAVNMRGLIQMGRLDDVESAITLVVAPRKGVWPQGMEAIRHSLRFEGSKFPKEAYQRITSWLNLFEPEDLDGQLKLYVSEAPYESEEDNEGMWHDVAAERAEKLGCSSAKHWEQLLPFLPRLMKGAHRQAYSFGRGLSASSKYDDHRLNELMTLLAGVSLEERNSAVVSGWLASWDDHDAHAVDSALKMIAGRTDLNVSLPSIVRGLQLNDSRVSLLSDLLHRSVINPMQLHGLANGRSMQGVSVVALATLCDELLTQGAGTGAWVALDLTFMYGYDNKEKQDQSAHILKRVLQTKGLLSGPAPPGLIDAHHAARAAIALSGNDPAFVESIAAEVIAGISQQSSSGNIDFALTEILAALLEKQLDVTWPVIKRALADTHGIARWKLKNLLGGRMADESKPRLISKVPLAYLREWCSESPANAPITLASIAPLAQSGNDGQPTLSDFAIMLLNDYGNSDEVLSAMAANLNTFSWMGSLTTLFERRIRLIHPLLNHRSEKVRNWANAALADANDQIDRERQQEAEGKIGRYS